MTRGRKPWIAIAVVPLMLIIGLESAWAAFACRMDGEVRDRCCCPSTSREEAPSNTTIDARCCCDITLHASADVAPAREQSRIEQAHVAVVMPVVILAPVLVRTSRILEVTPIARPPPWRALYLDKQSLLR